MKLTPQQAPLYGRCVITVQLTDEELAADEEGAANAANADYFLLFAGSTQRHLSSTLRSGHDTLQALCPAHGCCEEVSVTLCAVTHGEPEASDELATLPSHVAALAEHRFTFVQDLAFDMAQFLVSTVGRTDGLDGALLLDECHIPLLECERLDESLALALHHIPLPPGWNLLGNQSSGSVDQRPRETLLHFSARRGLVRVTRFLLWQPGARDAARLLNKQGHTPAAIAALRGHASIQQLLAQAEADAESDRGPQLVQPLLTDARVVCHHSGLHALTQSVYPGHDPPSLGRTVEQLLHLTSHLHAKRVSVLELRSDCLHTAAECREGVEPETASCPQTNAPEDRVENGASVTYGYVGEEDGSVSLVHPGEHGLSPPEDWVCLETEKVEGRKQPDTTQNLSLYESQEPRSPLPVENLRLAGWGEQETDKGGEGREATLGEDLSGKEVNGVSESTGEKSSGGLVIMGQLPSSDAPVQECHRDGFGPDLCQGNSLAEEEVESTAFVQEDLPPPAGCDDVTLESDVPPPGEGEPPPDVKSSEQNQETAGQDHVAEWQQDPDQRTSCQKLNVTENADVSVSPVEEYPEETECSPENIVKSDIDPNLGLTHGLSSDDNVSFQSVGSCATDIFHPTEESIPLEEQQQQPTEGFAVEKVDQNMHLQTSAEPAASSEETNTTLESGLHTEGSEETGAPEPAETDQSLGRDTPAGMVLEENPSSADLNEEVEVIMSKHASTICGADKTDETDSSMIHRDGEASLQQPLDAQHSGSSRSSTLPALSSRTHSSNSCSSTVHKDSASDIESLLSAEVGYDSVFIKNDERVTCGDSTSEVSISCSSTDDTASVGPSSSSPEGSQGLGSSGWSPEEGLHPGASVAATDGGGGVAGDAEEEAKDRVAEVPRRCLLRSSLRSFSPLRRHSWGPGKNNGGGPAMNQRSCKGRLTLHRRSYSLEGLSGSQEEARRPAGQGPRILEPSRMLQHDMDERGSLVSLTEEQEETGPPCGLEKQRSRRYRPLRNSCPPMTLPLTKSVSMLAISHRDIDVVGRLRRRRRISFSFSLSPILTKSKSHTLYGDSSTSDDDDNFSMRSFSSTSGSLAYSISEEEPGPLRSDAETTGKGGTKVSRTFSYLKNKMYKKTKEKEKDKKEKEAKEKEKKAVNGHHFAAMGSSQAPPCSHCFQCNKALSSKELFQCTYCNACVHKSCRDGLAVCAKVKMKLPRQHLNTVPDSSSFPGVTMRNKSCGTRERPWSVILSPEDHSSLTLPQSRRHTSLMPFHGNNLSKSLSISNIAGPVFDEIPIRGLRYLSQSTDSLNRTNQVTESMESLTDEGHYIPSQPWTEMMDSQLMGEFEGEAKEMEADSWSLGVEHQYLQQLDRNLVKRQDVIYELMQTEMHHIRTLRIMSEVYSKGLQMEVQLEPQILERLFPALDELLELHTQLLLRLLERKRESQAEGGRSERGLIVHRIGDILLSQFSGCNSESIKRIYGRFCSRHNEAVNLYKDLLTKEKRFKAFIKKKMSSSIVRRLSIPECILLVTQRITKYPVLIQRILQHTKEGDSDYDELSGALRLVKETIAGVDGRVNEHDKRRRLKDFHSRTDTKSIMMMKSGQIFAREDLLRRRLVHDGALQLKSSQGRLKDVHALLLSDVLVFLQEKDQKYVFAMLDQRSTVISLQKLIVREVANEERGLFLITAGIEKPEMMEVLASSKEERNAWMQLIQDAMQSMERDEDEGIPSETEDDKRQLEIKAKEMRDLLKQKDSQIMSLLEEKVRLFRGMCEGSSPVEEACRQTRHFFRSPVGPDPPMGACVMKDALQEVETLQTLVNSSLGGAMAGVQDVGGGGGAPGSGCLPRRAETFGGFDSHQMHLSKNGDKDESEDATRDLRRTESDSVLKKGGNANLLQLLKRNSEQVLHSVSNLYLLLSTLQAVVVQQDSFIEDQRQALSERSPSACSSSRSSSRPSSLVEQEKQRSLEKQRQELASLQRQQAAHAEERRRREKEWELRERLLGDKETLLNAQQEDLSKQQRALEDERRELASRKEDYQRDLERLRDAQRKLDKDREALQRQLDKMDELRRVERTPSTASEESQLAGSCQSLDLDHLDMSSSSSSSSTSQRCKAKTRSLNPFTSSSSSSAAAGVLKAGEASTQLSKSLLQLAKHRGKEGKDKRKKKVKGKAADSQHLSEAPLDGEIFFC
ncbi:A-kinase anchor protein 13 isoform X2 [Hippocampus zosterae]|uniref:A-kinase anchor protein 13 isoform X2 n=1 Tax=Hippocampus zosterae TaxID=109293 RepID=UPI00223CE396|nr:A-kinase anchor protein 13 isoform X2 [Hippocampus zosterae]XP_051920232.1 A-kinase anchor protein 13 isoform X2 [Hippocampus zosterae]